MSTGALEKVDESTNVQVSPKVGFPNVGDPYVGKPYPLVRLRGSKNESSKDTPPSKRPDSPYTATNRLSHHIPLPSTGNGFYGHESRAYGDGSGQRHGRDRPATPNTQLRCDERGYLSGPLPLSIAHSGQTFTGKPRSTPSRTRNRTPQ